MIYSNKLLLLSMRKIRRESQVNLQNMSFIKIDTLLSNPSPLQSISSRDFKTLHSNSHSFALNSHIGSRTNLPHVNSGVMNIHIVGYLLKHFCNTFDSDKFVR